MVVVPSLLRMIDVPTEEAEQCSPRWPSILMTSLAAALVFVGDAPEVQGCVSIGGGVRCSRTEQIRAANWCVSRESATPAQAPDGGDQSPSVAVSPTGVYGQAAPSPASVLVTVARDASRS